MSADDQAQVFVNDPDILPRCKNLSVISREKMRDVIKSAQVELDGNATLNRPGLYDVKPDALEAFKRRLSQVLLHARFSWLMRQTLFLI